MSAASKILADHADRAQRFATPGLIRIQLHQIGFYPPNRGGTGIHPYHVHEVANDFMANTTKVDRYGHVDLVRIPEVLRQSILKANEK